MLQASHAFVVRGAVAQDFRPAVKVCGGLASKSPSPPLKAATASTTIATEQSMKAVLAKRAKNKLAPSALKTRRWVSVLLESRSAWVASGEDVMAQRPPVTRFAMV